MATARSATVHKATARRDAATPLLEWTLGGFGALLLTIGVIFLVREALEESDAPGSVTAQVEEISEVGEAFLVRYTLHNGGRQTLSNVQVTARLKDGDREVATARGQIDYLPGRSTHEGGFYLREDPRRYTLEIAPEGYQSP